ncbi:Bacteroidetes-Associated Carbohydrate-binding Often N-terminal [uncultured Caudovirales phage]|uniref:Bacteroidetes-Associated Carbohydrate-binding Often N-terminal n=1 Tax=uncultured Caudovirales phage TaxID=2100421 RepID=A0A6J5MKE1_9CAUD|nr:Bacteroidetes-Associated Carbohydrate-binding Often N-terminal [uncultured Caudovirales phage]
MDIALYISDLAEVNYQRLDLFKDEDISINLTSKNISDISKVFAEFTQGFSVPASQNNNAIFSHWYDATVDGLFNANKRVTAYIEVNTLPFKYGVIQLDSCKLKGGQISSYELTFFNKVVNLSDSMGDLELKDLILTAYDHAYNKTNVTSAMYSDSIHSGDVYYPMITSTKDINYGDNSINDIKYASNTIKFTDFKPALRLIRIIEAIETDLNVTFSRDFFGRSVFHNLFMWLHKDAKGVNNEGQKAQIDFTDKGDLETLTGITVDLTDNYIICNDSIFSQINIKITPSAGYENVPYILERYLDGEPFGKSPENKGTTWTEFRTDNDTKKHTFFINVTQEFKFTTILQIYYFSSGSGYLNATFTEQTVVGNISIANNMPTLKLKDFFGSLINQFNLIIVPTSANGYYIDTLDNWYSKGDTFDITHLINIDDITIKKPDIKKLIEFKYQSAGAILGKQFLDTNGIGYGDLKAKYDDIAGSDLKIESQFENLNFEKLQDVTITPSVTSKLHLGSSINSKFEPYAGKPYMFYKNGLVTLTDTIYIDGISLSSVFLTGTEDNADFNQITNSLNFGSEISTYFLTIVNKSLYSNFWQTYVTDLYNQKTRVLNLKCKLPISILSRLSLNDKLIINNNKYKISNLKVNLINSDADLEIFTDYSMPADTISNEIPLTVDRTDITVDTDSITVDRISTYDALYSFIVNGISRTTYTSTNAKEYFEIKVTANTTWSVVKIDTGDGVTWFNVDKTSGNRTQYTMVTVNANVGVSRTGTLRYIIGGVNFDLIITQ